MVNPNLLPAMNRILLFFCVLISSLSIAYAQSEAESGEAEAETSYTIRPLDTILFKIVGELETDLEDRVNKEGTVAFPYLLKPVKIADLTLQEARKKLYDLYVEDVYVNPQIQLVITGYAERRVGVQGMVMRQGFVEIPPEESMYLLGAISSAGGWNQLSNKKKVELHRTRPDGEVDVEVINANDIGPKDHPLQPGDYIFVPEIRF